MKNYKQAIENVYEKFYGDLGSPYCKYNSECKGDFDTQYGYQFSYAAKIGENYGCDFGGDCVILPKVVAIGKECPYKDSELQKPSRMKDFEKVNPHYRETFRQLKEICFYNTENRSGYKNQPDDILTCYALTNVFRCAFKEKEGQRSGIKNSTKQKKYCPHILMEELDALEPDIVILQSGDVDPLRILPADGVAMKADDINGFYYSESHNRYLIQVCHPTSYGNYYNGPLSIGNFLKAVEYLRSKGVLASEDQTEKINRIFKHR